MNIEGLCWSEIVPLKSKHDLPQFMEDLTLRVSFYDSSLDTEMCPVIYSEEKEFKAHDVRNNLDRQFREIHWS